MRARAGRVRGRGRVCARVSVPLPRNAQCAPHAQAEPIQHQPGVGGGTAAGSDGQSETDVSAAMQMGLGAALTGELSGDGVPACVCVCVAMWYRFSLAASSLPTSLLRFLPPSRPLSASIQPGFPTSHPCLSQEWYSQTFSELFIDRCQLFSIPLVCTLWEMRGFQPRFPENELISFSECIFLTLRGILE